MHRDQPGGAVGAGQPAIPIDRPRRAFAERLPASRLARIGAGVGPRGGGAAAKLGVANPTAGVAGEAAEGQAEDGAAHGQEGGGAVGSPPSPQRGQTDDRQERRRVTGPCRPFREVLVPIEPFLRLGSRHRIHAIVARLAKMGRRPGAQSRHADQGQRQALGRAAARRPGEDRSQEAQRQPVDRQRIQQDMDVLRLPEGLPEFQPERHPDEKLGNDLRVLQEIDAVATHGFAANGHRLGREIGQLVVHRLVLADQEVNRAVLGLDSDGQSAANAFLGASGVLRAMRAVVEVTGHVKDFALDRDLAAVIGGVAPAGGGDEGGDEQGQLLHGDSTIRFKTLCW